MKRQFRWILLFGLVMAGGLALLFFFSRQPDTVQASNQNIALRAPAFVETALAVGEPSVNAIASVLDNEAGIAAYFQTTPLTLSTVEGLFHTILIKTSDYILGTIAVPENLERYDVHVYIHKSGWILLYYLRDDPAVMIFDWQKYDGTMNPTRFQVVSNQITTVLSRSAPTLTYYDFRYPDATNMLLAVEDVQDRNGDGSFTILDTNFQYYERSWFLGGQMASLRWSGGGADAELKLDGVQIYHIENDWTWEHHWGTFTPVELSPDQSHEIYINLWDADEGTSFMMGVLTIIYGPQP